jgi:hypothetical protein
MPRRWRTLNDYGFPPILARTWHAPIAGLFVPNQVTVPTARAGSSPWLLECDEGLTGWGLPGTPAHPQSAEQKGAEEHDNADEQQEQQAFGDDADDA